MVSRLLDDVIHWIIVCLENNEEVLAIQKATRSPTIYRIRLEPCLPNQLGPFELQRKSL
jgi:hypothetical protein